MKEFMKKHPALEDTCDTVLSLLSGSFALLAVGFVWGKELIDRENMRRENKTYENITNYSEIIKNRKDSM